MKKKIITAQRFICVLVVVYVKPERKLSLEEVLLIKRPLFACCMYVKWFVNNPGNGQEALELHFRLKTFVFGLNLRNHHRCRRSHKPINVSILAS